MRGIMKLRQWQSGNNQTKRNIPYPCQPFPFLYKYIQKLWYSPSLKNCQIPNTTLTLSNCNVYCLHFTMKQALDSEDIKSFVHGTAGHYSKFYYISQIKACSVVTYIRHQIEGGETIYRSPPIPPLKQLSLIFKFLIL